MNYSKALLGIRHLLFRALALLAAVPLVLASCSSDDAGPGPVQSNARILETGCAAYDVVGQTRAGVMTTTGEGANERTACTYGSSFVDFFYPLSISITLSDDVDRHIFLGSLVVGNSASTDAGLRSFGIGKGGDGPTLTIQAGVDVGFARNDDYLLINRGAQLVVEGTAAKPVTLTGAIEFNESSQYPGDSTQLWGGLIINGFGVTNSCSYIGTRGEPGFVPAGGGCHVLSEGTQGGQSAYYGGANDADSSGSINYLVVKHAGSEVEKGSELNGVTFNAVGSGTTVNNLQVYRAFDDGIEFFGGAVDVSNYVALYVDDDSIDIDAGYTGTISNALVIQEATNGNRCIEADGIVGYSALGPAASADLVARRLNSAPTLRNITCIVSANESASAGSAVPTEVRGTHGDAGEGVRLREGIHGSIEGLIVSNAYSIRSSLLRGYNSALPGEEKGWTNNWCLDIDDDETLRAAGAGQLSITRSIFACTEAVDQDKDMITVNGGEMTESQWLDSQTMVYRADVSPLADPGMTTDPALALFEEASYRSLPADQIALPGVSSVAMPSAPGFAGGGEDWTTGWTFGLSAGDCIWFAPSDSNDSDCIESPAAGAASANPHSARSDIAR